MRSVLLMLALAGAVSAPSALAAEPSAYALATHAAMRGSLVSDPEHPVVNASVYFSEDESEFPPLDGMSRDALRAEARRLTEESPSIATGLTITILGGCGLLTGFILLYVGFIELVTTSGSSAAATAYVLFGLGAALMVGGGLMLAIGLVRLIGSIRERRAYSERLEEINKRLEGGDQVPPGYEVPPPPPPGLPPPPPPPAAMGNIPDASVLVATF